MEVSPRVARWLIAGLALLLGGLTQFGLHRPLINDEAIELQVAEGLPLDRFYFFAPGEAYPRGQIVPVEALAPYLNHSLFALCKPWLISRAAFTVPVRCLNIVAFAAACLIIYEVASRRLIAGLCAAGSGYGLLMSQFLTRNALSLFWGAAALWLIRRWLQRRRSYWAPIGCALAFIAGCWTYTIFKPFAVAAYTAMFVGWLRFSRVRGELAPIVVSAGVFAVGLGAMILLGGSSLPFYFHRGGYALGSNSHYLHNLLLTLCAPFYYTAHGEFLEEDVHVMIGRAVLSPLLWALFPLGLARAFASREPFQFLIGTLWALGMISCASAGPNLKYQYAFLPLTLLLAIAGLHAVVERLPLRLRGRFPAEFMAAYVVIEMWNVFQVFPTSDCFGMNRTAPVMAEKGMAAASENPGAVLLQPDLGFDTVNWYLFPPASASKVRIFRNARDVPSYLATNPSPTPTLLLTDYPPDTMFPALGWTPPSSLQVVNVRVP